MTYARAAREPTLRKARYVPHARLLPACLWLVEWFWRDSSTMSLRWTSLGRSCPLRCVEAFLASF